jgi:hypothetical protein
MRQSVQIKQAQVSQQEELIQQLQSKLISAENQAIDIDTFWYQATEIQQKVEIAQQGLLAKVEIIQNHFQTIDQVLKDISLREREAGVARIAFQEVVVATTKEGMVGSVRLSISEQTRGNILLKAWEHNISESRERAKEMKNSCEETFGLINKNLLNLDKEDSSGHWEKLT